MPRGGSKFAAAGFDLCLLLLGIVFALSTLSFEPPSPVGAESAKDVFSAVRAHGELVRLLGDEAPHPVGSPANDLVRARLVERLVELGFTPEVQDAIACSRQWPVCGRVRNVLARFDGESRSAVLLMAHYDSVASGPGAGDDGAGVATMLEVARALQGMPPARNSIVFAFTDAEESGLLGAEAFFSKHPWAGDVAVVVNLEGSGSSGPSILFRSASRSGVALDAFRESASHPVAASFAQELFRHLPNDTDLSVANRAGRSGIDFAFVGERHHYHTARDSIANLSLATLQHHGENVLPLVRTLSSADLSNDAPNYVFTTLTQSLWLAYRPQTGLLISIVAVVALGLATWRRWQGLGHFSAALGIVVLAFTMIVLLELALLALADLIAGTRVNWPANPWPWRLVIYSLPIVAVALQRPLVRRVGFWNTLLAAWWFWGLLALALAWFAPLASHVMLPPVAAATIVIVVLAFAHPLDRPVFRCTAAIINALLAGFFMLPLAYTGEIVQGLTAAPVMFVPLALVAVTLLPLLDRGRVKVARWIASLAAVAGIAWVYWTPLYSEQRPQLVNFTYALDADENRASYLAWSPNPLPDGVIAAMPFAKQSSPLPWEREEMLVVPTTVVTRATTALGPVSIVGATRTLRLHAAAETNTIELAIPTRTTLGAIRVDGQRVAAGANASGDHLVLRLVAPPPTGITIEIDATTPDGIDAYLIDSRHGLPDSGQALIDGRTTLAVPVRDGDSWVVFRRVRI